MPYFAGVDLGATNLRAAVADENAETVGSARRGTPQGPDGAAVEAALRDVLRTACADADCSPTDLTAVGVACAGRLDRALGTIEDLANVPEVDRIRVRDPLGEEIGGGPVAVVNDATAGVVGERFAADEPVDDVVYLTISSGIGAGVCVDGHVLGGWNGNAGEVGHVVVDPAGQRTCGCGVPGHWEAYCSGEHLPGYARQLRDEEGLDTALDLDGPGLSAADLFAAAGDDPLVDRLLDRVADWNAIGVATIVHAYAPRVIAIGGAVALNNPGQVIDPIAERVEDLVVTDVPEIRPTVYGEDVVLYGAVGSAIAADADGR